MKIIFSFLVAGFLLLSQNAIKKFTHEQYEFMYNADTWHEGRRGIIYNKTEDNYQGSLSIEVLKNQNYKDGQNTVIEGRKHQLEKGYVISSIHLNSKEAEFKNVGKGVEVNYKVLVPGMAKELRIRIWVIQAGDNVFKISSGYAIDHFDTYITEVMKVLSTLKRV